MQLPFDLTLLVPLFLAGIFFLAISLAVVRKIGPKFSASALVNKSERRLFELLRLELSDDLWIFPQVSYGAMLRNRSYKRYISINAKRADFVVCNLVLHPILVIEYQGAGHYGKTSKSRAGAERRDRAKRSALIEADIPLLEIPAQFDRASIRAAVAPWVKAAAATL